MKISENLYVQQINILRNKTYICITFDVESCI